MCVYFILVAITDTVVLEWTSSFNLSIDDMFMLSSGDIAVMVTDTDGRSAAAAAEDDSEGDVARQESAGGNTDFRWLTLNRDDGTVKSDVSWGGDGMYSM